MRELGLYQEVEQERKEDMADEELDEIEKSADLCAFRKYLMRRNEVYTLERIVFVKYVEEVYEALVKEGAFPQSKGTVELDPAKLGYLHT